MPYLDPPPFPAPVIVQKDVGGYVSEYRAQTERYRAENREVQLHECRSACTLALSLPGVCVYPTSVLKFHKAYDVHTRIADEGISRELFDSYPAPVRARLGELTRDYKVLTGAELIALGVRNCADDRIMIARRPVPPEPRTQIASAAEPGGSAFAGAFQSVLTAVARPFEGASAAMAPRPGEVSATALSSGSSVTLVHSIPLPPKRPDDLSLVELAVYRPETSSHLRPSPELPSPGLPETIPGSQRVVESSAFLPIAWLGY